MAKVKKEAPQLLKGFPKGLQRDFKSSEPLVPPRKRNPWPYIVPSVLLVGVLTLGGWLYLEFLTPQYFAEESRYSESLAVAEEYEGELIVAKEQEDDCYSLEFDRGDSIHLLCVSEEFWNEQQVGEPFDLTVLRENEVEPAIPAPW